MEMFPSGVWSYGIKTGKWNGSGYPPVYKVDLAFPRVKLAIEADGSNHGTWDNRKAKDAKKDAFLAGLGWKVLRYSNRAILDFRQSVVILADVEFLISTLPDTRATA
jgi:very-short-patch-repair endonuclease